LAGGGAPIQGLSAPTDEEGVLVGVLVGVLNGVEVATGPGVLQADNIKTKATAILNCQISFIFISL